MNIEVRATGIPELARRYQQAPTIVHEELVHMVDRLTIAGSTESKRHVGVKSGHGRRSLTHEPARFVGGAARGQWGTNISYARWHNDGTRPHIITPRKGKALAWKGSGVVGPVLQGVTGTRGGGTIFARIVHHPGTKGRKFMQKGLALVRRRIKAEGDAAARRIAARLSGGR